jgi:hypothetical protein
LLDCYGGALIADGLSFNLLESIILRGFYSICIGILLVIPERTDTLADASTALKSIIS